MSFLGEEVSLNIFCPNFQNKISFSQIVIASATRVEFGDLSDYDRPDDFFGVVSASLDIGRNFINYRITDNYYTSFASGDFNGYVMRDVGGDIPRIVDVTIVRNTFGIEGEDVFFNHDAVFVNVEGLSFHFGDQLRLKVTFGIEGDARANTLTGTVSRDWLFGEAGNDRLDGRAGIDELSGGLGRDRFVFGDRYGRDTIVDFENDRDTIVLKAASLGIDTVGEALDGARRVGNDVVLDFGGGDRVIVEDVRSVALLANDIMLI